MIFTRSGGKRRFWRYLSLTTKGCIAAGVPLIVLIAGFANFTARATKEKEVQSNLVSTIGLRENLSSLLRDLLVMESSGRGFVLTPHDDLQARYLDARRRVTADLDRLEYRASHDPGRRQQLALLQVFASEKVQATEAFFAAGSSTNSTLILRSSSAMQRVREAVQEIDDQAEDRQRQELAELGRMHARTLFAGNTAIVLGLIASLGSITLFARMVRRRLKALQLDARALKMEVPLASRERSFDELGELRSELERTSESLAKRVVNLRARQAQTQAMIDNTTAVIYLKDLESRFIVVNQAYEQNFGLKSEAALGRSPVELFGEELGGRIRAHDLAVLESKQPAQFEETIVVKGKRYTYLAVKAPLFDAAGEVCGISGVSTDITDHASAFVASVSSEAAESRAPFLSPEELRTAGRLAGSVAHDLNNILVAIVGHSSLLKAELTGDVRVSSHAAEILRASQRAAVLARQLLVLRGPSSDRLRVIEVEELLAELKEALEPMTGDLFPVTIQGAPTDCRVEIDPAQIEQILLNLCVNARDAMPEGGTIALSAASTWIRKGEIAEAGGEFVAISVSDTGEGIPLELQARMYDGFSSKTESAPGRGFGLTASSMIAQQNGGWLQCKSEVGVGATFTLFLPRAGKASSDAPEKPSAPALPMGSRETVLVVEDEPDVGEMQALLLRTLGYKVILTRCGDEAESVLARSGTVDLVMTDLNLPRMNGRQLIKRMQRRSPTTKFILTSGAQLEAEPKSRTAILKKPYAIKELAETVRTVLDT